MDILADPDNTDFWPLKLISFNSEIRERKTRAKPHSNSGLLCKFYCEKNQSFLVTDPLEDNEKILPQDKLDAITTLEKCYQCSEEEIIDGIIYHHFEDNIKWFIIDREIAVLFPTNLRDTAQEETFINKYTEECEKLGIKI